ncbi:hypothetical protein GCM10010295_13190 [Streptomyces intermedius]
MSRPKRVRAGKWAGSAPKTATRKSSRPCSRSGGGTADRGLGGDQGGDEDREAVVAGRDLLVGQARRAQGLEQFLHDQSGTGAARGVPAPDGGQLGVASERLADPQGHGRDALLPVALGAVAVHGGQEDPVGDRRPRPHPVDEALDAFHHLARYG